MFTDERYDFSQESDFKARLWEKMEQRMKQAGPARKEVSLESISPAMPQKKPHQPDEIKTNGKDKGAMRPKK